MQRTLRFTIATIVASLLVAVAPEAEAKQHRYVGVHPIAKNAGGGTCHIEVPHVHTYAPVDVKVQYVDHDGWHHFVGDPVAHGYDGPRHAYHGAHPIYVDVAVEDPHWEGDHHVEYCYLKGPHYHYYAPPPQASFELHGDVHWYVGTFPDEFQRARPARAKINVVYEPMVYARPVVTVEPPEDYVDVLIVVEAPVVEVTAPAAAVVAPAVVVETPRPRARVHATPGVHLDVHVPAPVVEVGIGVGVGVEVHGHRHKRGKHKKYKKHKKRHYRGH